MIGIFQIIDPGNNRTVFFLLLRERLLHAGEFLGAFLLFVVDHAQMLLVGALLFPLEAVALHDQRKLFLLRLYPLCPLRRTPGAAAEALGCQRLLQRDAGIEAALASRDERNEINVDMGRRLVHVEMGGEDVQIGIAFLKAPEVFVQHGLGLQTDLRFRAGILPVADLQDQFVEGLLLLAGPNLVIVIVDPPIGTGLPVVVPL